MLISNSLHKRINVKNYFFHNFNYNVHAIVNRKYCLIFLFFLQLKFFEIIQIFNIFDQFIDHRRLHIKISRFSKNFEIFMQFLNNIF